tara:strand:+ start:44 stop:643 length:600 start_codon:yes stop_codon:yes gene_type:complete
MNRNTVIQFFLLGLVIFLSIAFYNKYFIEQESKKEIVRIEENQEKVQKIEEENNSSNIIENLRYTSQDLLGNTYIIEAVSAKFFNKKTNEIQLIDVNAKIIQKNNDIIFIKSKTADYDKISNNTIFQDNVNILYGEQKINAKIIKLNFLNNYIEILENVHYINESSNIFADKVEIDLISKKLKISMMKPKDKVSIISSY